MDVRLVKQILILVVFKTNLVTCLVTLNLGGIWHVKNIEKGYNINATVPGGIYTDLMENKIIEDVFYGYNDVKTRWVSKLNWNYSKDFFVDEQLLAHNNIYLVFNGVDTFSDIILNNVKIGTTGNMFVRYVFNVNPYLHLGTNTLEVQFKSAVTTARALFRKQSTDYIVPPFCVPADYNGECHVNHIRKMQASFGWDWGPALPSMGIWKDVFLNAYNSSILIDVMTFITSDNIKNAWNLQIDAYFEENQKNSIWGELRVELQTDNGAIIKIYKIYVQKNANGEYVSTQNISIPKTYVNLWWPNGHGQASLYQLKLTFKSPDKQECTTRTLKIGFRTVELVQNVLEKGQTFYLKINQVPIFMKGSNIIPISILPELGQNEKDVKYLLQSAKDANMNMLRVWGGGVYESDIFYKLADELGLLIWQDFMFACSMYPVDESFLRNVTAEVNHQVRRLQYHPSIAIWAASNENEAALRENWYGTKTNFSLYKNDFKTLYVNTIKKQVLLKDTTRPFLTSSPTNGILTEKEDYVAEDPQSHLYGDVHFYNYLIDGFKPSVYPISRFISEYGYQSLPCLETLLSATNNTEHLHIYDNFLRHRQHHMFGYIEMDLLINSQLRLPDDSSPHFNNAYIFYSQIIQAMSVKVATEKFRTWRSNMNDIGEGLTMGALYWQLNDVWAAPSWSSIDFKQRWKPLHYYAKNFFAPVIISNELTVTGILNTYVVSDLRQLIQYATLNISVYKWNCTESLVNQSVKFDVLPGFSQKVKIIPLETLLSKTLCGIEALKNCFLYFTLTDTNSNFIAPDNFLFPTALKSANLIAPKLKIIKLEKTDANIEITTETDVVALFVWMEAGNISGKFSDNGFVQVTKYKVVQFFPNEVISMETFKKALTVTNLIDNHFEP